MVHYKIYLLGFFNVALNFINFCFFSLRDNLLAYVEEKYSKDEWSKLLPEQLKVEDAPRVFKVAVLMAD